MDVHLRNIEISDEMGKKRAEWLAFFVLEENDNYFGRFYQPTFHKTIVPLPQNLIQDTYMELSEKQKAAHRLAAEYFCYLDEQEALLDRLLERKWKQIEPRLEQMIERKIQERLQANS